MAKNPMQKKAQTSFILGMLLSLVVMGLVVAFLLYTISNLKKESEQMKENLVTAYILNQDIRSGETIDGTMFTKADVNKASVPAGALTLASIGEGTIAKIDLEKGTILTESMVTEDTTSLDNSLRIQEYNMLRLATQIETDDYIDIRLRMPSGLDYIVVSKKKVEVPSIDGVDSVNTIWVKLTEEETLCMSNAIVEAYQNEGAILYTTEYVEPGLQGALTPTYVPSAEVVNLVTQNPNIENEARQAMYNRYNNYISIRNSINNELSAVEQDDRNDNLYDGVATEVESASEQRQAYLDALAGY